MKYACQDSSKEIYNDLKSTDDIDKFVNDKLLNRRFMNENINRYK